MPRELHVVVVGVDPRIVGELGIGVEPEAEPVLRRLKLLLPRIRHVTERELRTARAVVEVVAEEDVELHLESVLLVRLLERRQQEVVPAGLRPFAGEVPEQENHVIQVERRALSGDVPRAPHLDIRHRGAQFLRRLNNLGVARHRRTAENRYVTFHIPIV